MKLRNVAVDENTNNSSDTFLDSLKVMSSDSVTPGSGALSWSEIVKSCISPVIATYPLGDEKDFRGTMTEWQMGNIRFVKATTSGVGIKGIHEHDPEHKKTGKIWFSFCLDGAIKYSSDDRSHEIHCKNFALINYSRPYQVTFAPNTEALWVCLPGSYFPSAATETELSIFDGSRGVGHLAFQAFSNIFNQAEHIDSHHYETIAFGAMNFLLAAIREQIDRKKLPRSRQNSSAMRRIESYVTQQLMNDDLSPQSVADALSMNPRYINKLFEKNGTSLMRWVLKQRLSMAAHLLEVDTGSERTVSAIAYSSGFKNISHFSRVFKDQYGLSPGQYRQQYTDLSPKLEVSPQAE